MLINIPEYIANCSYFIETEKSRSYVYNSKTKREYLFEGVVSDIWNFMLNNPCYTSVKEYAIRKQFDGNLEEFLEELQYIGVLKSENFQELEYISENSSENLDSESELFVQSDTLT